MEVHHPQHPTHKKKWSEYIIEFVMLFAAVTLGFFAENVREHNVDKHKAILSIQNLYKDLKEDSVGYSTLLEERRRQDSIFILINQLNEEKNILNEIPSVYGAHSLLTIRSVARMNTMALDQIKSSGNLNFIDNEDLKREIQIYSSLGKGLKLREDREFGYIDRMLDPITIERFEYKIFKELCANDNVKIVDNKIPFPAKIPNGLKIINEKTFDWNNYFSILNMLSTIRNSTDRTYIIPTQNKCTSLLALVRTYLKENHAFIEEKERK